MGGVVVNPKNSGFGRFTLKMARQQGPNHATVELPGYGEATADFNSEFVPMNVDRMLSQTHHDPSIVDLVDIDKQEIPVLGHGLVGHDLVQNPSVLLLVYPAANRSVPTLLLVDPEVLALAFLALFTFSKRRNPPRYTGQARSYTRLLESIEVALGTSFGWLFFCPLLEILVDDFKIELHTLDLILLLDKLLFEVADFFGEIRYLLFESGEPFKRI